VAARRACSGVAIVVIRKAAILAGVVRAGYWNVVPLAAGLTLFQVGEFAFVLARVGQSSGAISNAIYALTLNAAIVTMALTPVMSGLVPMIYRRFWSSRDPETYEAANLPSGGLAAHVIVAGAGRVGRTIADALAHLKLPFVIVELDDRRVQQMRAAGLPVIFGDASQPVSRRGGRQHNAAILLTAPPRCAQHCSAAPAPADLRLARARRRCGRTLYDGYQSGVAGFEAAIDTQALIYSTCLPGALRVASAIRRERCDMDDEQRASGLAMMSQIGDIARQLDFTWVGLPAGSPFDGRTLGDLRLRSTIGVSVVGVIRDGALVANPDGESWIQRGDLVAVLGTRDQIAAFEQAMRGAVVP
jgi:CPA2 family monovalent cation:H+ antiporter-2